jgi:Transcription factor WhiB
MPGSTMPAGAGDHYETARVMEPGADWWSRSACRGLSSLFDPPEPTADTEQQAAGICGSCPVSGDCRRWVMGLPQHLDPGGVLGGLTEEQRRRVRQVAEEVAGG